MREDYKKWLIEQGYQDNTQNAQIHRVKKVEEYYGDLEEHFSNGTYQEVINSLQYTTKDQRENKLNPSKIKFDGNVNLKNNLQSYRDAALRYQRFLSNGYENISVLPSQNTIESLAVSSYSEDKLQRLSLEKDMQSALRRNITSLEPLLKIIDDGVERAVNSGFIDITCEDNDSLVVIELKAGKVPGSAITQILGYMGDLMAEEEGKPVRGILVAHDFDQRTRSAARAVPNLKLKKYAIEFKFMEADQ